MRKLLIWLDNEWIKWLIRLFCLFLVISAAVMLLRANLGYLKTAMAHQAAEASISTLLSSLAREEEEMIMVDIGGAVKRPGIYTLKPDARLADLVAMAGGFRLTDSDAYYLQRNLNLAERLIDGMKYYVPYQPETMIQASDDEVYELEYTSTNVNNGLISVNQADLKTLMTLTGVGEVRGQAIIDNRPYAALDELVSKSAITQKILDDNKDFLSL